MATSTRPRGAFAQGQFYLESCEGRDGAVGGRCGHSVIAIGSAVAMIVHSESPIPDVMTGIGMEAGRASPLTCACICQRALILLGLR